MDSSAPSMENDRFRDNEIADRRQDLGSSEVLSMSYEQNDSDRPCPSPQPPPPSRLLSGDLDQMALTTQVQSAQEPGLTIPVQALIDAVGRVIDVQVDGTETTEEIDETLLTALRSSSMGSSRNFLEELTLLLEDDEDGWSDDELCGIEEWLAAIGFGDGLQVDVDPSSLSLEPHLGKALIKGLLKEVYHTNKSENITEIGSSSDKPKQEECSVCLEAFVSGQILICLPCNHRFHEDCVVPWLENHVHCPYCRTRVSFKGGTSSTSSNEMNRQTISLNREDVVALMEAVNSGLLNMGIR